MSTAVEHRWRPLKAVLGGVVDVPEDLEVSDLTQDSRSVTPGAAFFACRGLTHHGIEFAPAAAAAGARAILWEPAPGVQAPSVADSIVVRAVPNLRAQIGYFADRFFDAPSASLTVAGITRPPVRGFWRRRSSRAAAMRPTSAHCPTSTPPRPMR
jgi:UDP-N-acetylmuramoyl-L-alanyl-D-glutamate--2,6-diaminopimelate ligase